MMKWLRIFGGEAYELKPKSEKVGIRNKAYMIKADAQKEAKRRRKKGEKVRIVQNKSVKYFGGDIGFFIYSNKLPDWRRGK
jgi:hypothetical protein